MLYDMNYYKVKIVYEPSPIEEAPELELLMPDETSEEVVEVPAESFADITAGGRLVRFFDESGTEHFNSFSTSADSGRDSL